VKAVAQKHLEEIDRKMAELSDMRAHPERPHSACAGDHRPDCPILKGLAAWNKRRALIRPFIFPEIRTSREAGSAGPGLDAPGAPPPSAQTRSSLVASKNNASDASKVRPVRLPGRARSGHVPPR
jgi:hypothetical protein